MDPRVLAAVRPAVRVAATIVLAGIVLVTLDRLLARFVPGGELPLPAGAYEFAIMTVTVQYSETRRSLGRDGRDRALATLIGCLLGGLVWLVGGETIWGVALAVGVGWLAGGLLNQDFAPRTAAGVAGLLALGAGADAVTTFTTRTLSIAAATIASILVLWFVWPTPPRVPDDTAG